MLLSSQTYVILLSSITARNYMHILEDSNLPFFVYYVTQQSLLCKDNYSKGVSENNRPPENPPEKDEDDKLKFQKYIVPLFMDFAEKNKIDPMVCYEVAHEIELSLIENCRSKGFQDADIEVHKLIAEMNWKTRKKEVKRDKV
jgi:hypothetical protein